MVHWPDQGGRGYMYLYYEFVFYDRIRIARHESMMEEPPALRVERGEKQVVSQGPSRARQHTFNNEAGSADRGGSVNLVCSEVIT